MKGELVTKHLEDCQCDLEAHPGCDELPFVISTPLNGTSVFKRIDKNMYLIFHYLQSFICLQSVIIGMTLLSALLLFSYDRQIAQLTMRKMVSLRARTKV